MSEHATLSPSASDRWLRCPASVKATLGIKDESSVYAEMGTKAHALGELEARKALIGLEPKDYKRRLKVWEKSSPALSHDELVEMQTHVGEYVELLRERLALYPNSQLLLEQRVDTGVPWCWGTADAVIVSPVHVEIIDLKYGQGVAVDAVSNSQLRLYACGAMDMFADILGETELIRSTVFQPRRESCSTEELTPAELRTWRETILPIAQEALGDDAHFAPSEEACRWCPISGTCRAQLEEVFATDLEADPATLTPQEMADVQKRIPLVRTWLKAVEEAALDMAYSQQIPIPGYKVVLSGGIRTIADEAAASADLERAGLGAEDIYVRKMRGLGELEKALKALPKVVGETGRPRHLKLEDVVSPDAMGRTPGRPSLVPEDDPRPAIDPNTEAQKEFES